MDESHELNKKMYKIIVLYYNIYLQNSINS